MPRWTDADLALHQGTGLQALSEAQWQRTLTNALTAAGWLWYHTRDSRKSNKGFPDIVAVRPPHVLYIECKTESGVLTPEQRVWQQWLSQCPEVEYYVWRPRDYREATARIWQNE